MALDEASQAFLAQMATMKTKPFHEMTPEEARASSEALNKLAPDGPPVKSVTTKQIPVANGNIDVIIIQPSEKPEGIIVYYHGGGWVIGKASAFMSLGKHLAIQNNCTVVLVDYRKAPENKYPAAVDDSYTALLWVDANMEKIVGKRVPLIIAGDSAGGNISAVTAIRARDRKGPKIELQVLIYPVTADDFNNETYTNPENQLLLSKESMIWFWNHYAPNHNSRKEVDASPLYAKDLSGLPPAVVLTAGHDPLRQEGEAYAAKLVQAGVPIIFKRYEDQFHGFFTMVGFLPASEKAIAFVSNIIKQHLNKKS